jgi:hypothetical protein
MTDLEDAELHGKYEKCFKEVLLHYEDAFQILKNVSKNFLAGLYPLPETEEIKIKYKSRNLTIRKDLTDPFDIIFIISKFVWFRPFEKVFNECARNQRINFNYNDCSYLDDLFRDFELFVESNCDMKIYLLKKGKRIEIQVTVVLDNWPRLVFINNLLDDQNKPLCVLFILKGDSNIFFDEALTNFKCKVNEANENANLSFKEKIALIEDALAKYCGIIIPHSLCVFDYS